MRRSTVLNLPLQLVFLAYTHTKVVGKSKMCSKKEHLLKKERLSTVKHLVLKNRVLLVLSEDL